MFRKTRSLLLALVCSVLLLLLGVIWGVWFAFPFPDATQQQIAAIQRHSRISDVLMLSGLIGILISSARLLKRLLAMNKN